MHVLCPFQQLLHVQLDVTGLQFHSLIFQEPREIVVHVGKDHVNGQWIFVGA